MEYTIDLDSLNGKSTELSTISTNCSTTYNNCENSLNSYSSTEISSLISKAKQCVKRLDTGSTNASNWLNNYLEEMQSVESDLASFSGSLDAPKEFSTDFTDLFTKVTVPAIRTGGDRNINNNLGPIDGDN